MVSSGCRDLRAAQPVTRAIRFHPTQSGATGHLRRRSQLLATMSVTRRSWLVLDVTIYVQPSPLLVLFVSIPHKEVPQGIYVDGRSQLLR